MKSTTHTQYKNALDAIGHLILTKPEAVTALLAEHGVEFSPPPKKTQLVNEVIEMLAENNSAFNEDLIELLDVHLEYKANEINQLINEDDEFLGGLVGGLAKGLVGAVGGLFGKKKKRGGGGAPRPNNNAAAQAAQAKADMQRQMEKMRQEQKRREEEARRRRQEEERRRRQLEEEDRRRRERQREEEQRLRAAQNKVQKAGMNPIAMIAIGLVALGTIGSFIMSGARKSAK